MGNVVVVVVAEMFLETSGKVEVLFVEQKTIFRFG